MYFFIALCLDQIVKYIVIANNCNVSIIPNIFNLMYVQNTGGVYGIFEGNNVAFIIISLIVLATISICSKFIADSKIKKILWQLIIAGGVR